MSKYVFGVDIGGTTVKLGLFTEAGDLMEKWEIPTVTADHGERIVPDVADSIKAKMAEKSIAKDDVIGIGIGAPGATDEDGVMTGGAVNLGWGVFNLRTTLEELTGGIKVKAANDANVAAYGEAWKGGGKGCKNMVAVTLGTGVGGGIIVGGKIVTGANGAGGEIGHIHIEDDETEKCNCGHEGCLEQYASATGVVRLAKRRLAKDDKPSSLRNVELSAKEVFDAVRAGDAVAIEIAERFGYYLGKGLAAVANVVNPEIILIGGGVSKAGDLLIPYIEPVFRKYVFPPCKNVEFKLAELGNDAGIYGSAGLILGAMD
ncbi:MAG: ROK family glucokinase [Lachnospiraceae bacterium]|nr:ROK family glucokinase [Lachnospiraceae bacterium]